MMNSLGRRRSEKVGRRYPKVESKGGLERDKMSVVKELWIRCEENCSSVKDFGPSNPGEPLLIHYKGVLWFMYSKANFRSMWRTLTPTAPLWPPRSTARSSSLEETFAASELVTRRASGVTGTQWESAVNPSFFLFCLPAKTWFVKVSNRLSYCSQPVPKPCSTLWLNFIFPRIALWEFAPWLRPPDYEPPKAAEERIGSRSPLCSFCLVSTTN